MTIRHTASDLLAEHGPPFISPSPHRIATYDDFVEERRDYGENSGNDPKVIVSLQLLPLPISPILLGDVQCILLNERPTPTISLPQQCLSLVRCIASYPLESNSRREPISELSALLVYGLQVLLQIRG